MLGERWFGARDDVDSDPKWGILEPKKVDYTILGVFFTCFKQFKQVQETVEDTSPVGLKMQGSVVNCLAW